ncbi:MAG: ACP S-malonyltransferase [Rickettsiales bacterium]|nr:ACP S-malonyltransferase [Rickettsiales bacterium]
MKAIVFPGQGSQTIGMAREFYDNFDIAKKVFQEVNDTLQKDLTKIMFEGPEDLLTNTENAQPAIMTASIAILEVLKQETGLKINNLCNYTAGHSLGEYTALCASNSINLADTAKLLKIRGKSFADTGKVAQGSMAAVIGASIEQVEELVNKARLENEVLDIANDNIVGQVVISGNINSIDNAINIASEMKIKRAVKLQVSGAFHSPLMESAIKNMETILEEISINKPVVEVFANYTANIEEQSEIKDNLLKQITGRVRWRETILNMKEKGVKEFVEIGSGKVLSNMIGRMCPEDKVVSINSIDTLKEYIKDI